MTEIIYNSETKEIQFSGYISSFKFYNQLFDALEEHYKDNGVNFVPKFSFVKVDDFEASVLPNIILVGREIKNKHNQKIELEILNTYATRFLESTLFFANVGKQKQIGEEIIRNNLRVNEVKFVGLDIFNFDTGFLGFYGNKSQLSPLNPDHKIQIFENYSYRYYENYLDKSIPVEKLEELLDTIRSKKYNEIEPYVYTYFHDILEYKYRDKTHVKTILTILSEIITNSVLYSYSSCIAMLQSMNGRTKISISDSGIGLEGSFKYKPNFDQYVTREFSSQYKEKLRNYLLIFDALHYSKGKDRKNLYTLLKLVIEKGGKMRIHYDDVQVVFNSSRCRTCEVIPLKCAKCLLDNLSDDKLISPVRFFNHIFKGIHIEVELDF